MSDNFTGVLKRKSTYENPDTFLIEERGFFSRDAHYPIRDENPTPYHVDGICWGCGALSKSLSHQAATKNFCFVGTVGSGKTVSIRLLLQTVLPLMVYPDLDHRALIYDPKQEMIPALLGLHSYIVEQEKQNAQLLERKSRHEKIQPLEIRTLNPFDSNGYAWDMAKDITERAHAQEIATILIPPEKNAHQPFFGDAARHLLEGVITSFMLSAGQRWTFRDVMYAMGAKERIIEVLNLHEETRELIPLYFDHKETSQNIMSTIATKTKAYKIIAALWQKAMAKKRTVSLVDWLKNRQERGRSNYILVLGNHETARTAIDALNQALFKRTAQLILNQPDIQPHKKEDVRSIEKNSNEQIDVRRHWIVLDELRNAGYLDGLHSLMTKGRSKGAAVVLSFQDIDGLRAVYGQEEANEIVGQCSSYAIFRLQSPETVKWAASIFGKAELKEIYTDTNKSKTETLSQSDQYDFFSYIFGFPPSSISTSYSDAFNWGSAKRIQYRETDIVHPSEFIYLKPANRENGIEGWYLSPYAEGKPYGVQLSGDVLFGEDGWLAKSVPYQMKPRGNNEQKLKPWTNKERIKLGLHSSLLADPKMREQNEQRKKDVLKAKAQNAEIKAIAQEYAEIAFYRGQSLTESELEELKKLSPKAEKMYADAHYELLKEADELEVESVTALPER